jgi:hypothetical protein
MQIIHTLWSIVKVVGSVWSRLLVGITRWSGLWLKLLLLLAADVFALLMNVHCLCQSMTDGGQFSAAAVRRRRRRRANGQTARHLNFKVNLYYKWGKCRRWRKWVFLTTNWILLLESYDKMGSKLRNILAPGITYLLNTLSRYRTLRLKKNYW